MRNRLLLMMLVSMFLLVRTNLAEEKKWILVADPGQHLPFWNHRMSKSGSEVSWMLREVQNQTILKITLNDIKESSQFMQIKMTLNSSEPFDLEIYQATSPVEFTFFSSNHISNQWFSQPNSFELRVNNDRVTISGQNFYLWITLPMKSSVNYILVFTFIVVVLVKTQLIFGLKNRFAAPEMIAPGLVIFYCLFWRGIQYSIQELIFLSPWKYGHLVGYSLIFYIYFPYLLKVFQHQKLFFSYLETILKVNFKYLHYFCSILFCYFIFFQVRFEAIIIFSLLETLLLFVNKEKQFSLALLSFYFADIIILFILNCQAIYPHQYQLGLKTNLFLGILCSVQVWAACRSKKIVGGKKKK